MSRAAAQTGMFIALLFAAWKIRGEVFLSSGDNAARAIRVALVVNSVSGVVLLVAGPFRPGFARAARLCPVPLALGLPIAATASDALAAGLPMVFVVRPVAGAMAPVWPLAGRKR